MVSNRVGACRSQGWTSLSGQPSPAKRTPAVQLNEPQVMQASHPTVRPTVHSQVRLPLPPSTIPAPLAFPRGDRHVPPPGPSVHTTQGWLATCNRQPPTCNCQLHHQSTTSRRKSFQPHSVSTSPSTVPAVPSCGPAAQAPSLIPVDLAIRFPNTRRPSTNRPRNPPRPKFRSSIDAVSLSAATPLTSAQHGQPARHRRRHRALQAL